MTFDPNMMYGYMYADRWHRWGKPGMAGQSVAKWFLEGDGAQPFVRGYAIRVAQG